MNVSGLDHFNISAPIAVLEEVKDFYLNVLGLETGFRPEFDRAGYWLYADEKSVIHLIENKTEKSSLDNGYFDHIALKCTGLDDVTNNLGTYHVPFEKRENKEANTTILFIHDPSGLRVELIFQW